MVDVNAAPKAWWASKTVWGSVIGGASLLAGLAGYHVDAETQQVAISETTALATALGTALATALTLWGRISATRPIR